MSKPVATVVAALAAGLIAQGTAFAQGFEAQINRDLVFQPNVQFFQNPALGDAANINRVYLRCVLRDEKTALVTNFSGAAVPQGAPIYLEATTIPAGQLHTELVGHGPLAIGGSFGRGVPNATACRAWFVRELVLAPN